MSSGVPHGHVWWRILDRKPIDAIAGDGGDPKSPAAAPTFRYGAWLDGVRPGTDPAPAGVARITRCFGRENPAAHRRVDPVGSDHHIGRVPVSVGEPNPRAAIYVFNTRALVSIANGVAGHVRPERLDQVSAVRHSHELRDPESAF